MKRGIVTLVLFLMMFFSNFKAEAQCSICTRTASQLGHKPGKALNAGILYLAAAPLILAGFIGYKWIRNNGGNS